MGTAELLVSRALGLGVAPLPTPRQIEVSDALSGAHNGELVEISGVIRSTRSARTSGRSAWTEDGLPSSEFSRYAAAEGALNLRCGSIRAMRRISASSPCRRSALARRAT